MECKRKHLERGPISEFYSSNGNSAYNTSPELYYSPKLNPNKSIIKKWHDATRWNS